jgi:hypothetical protein
MLHRPFGELRDGNVHTVKPLPKRRPSTIEHQTWRALGSEEVPNIRGCPPIYRLARPQGTHQVFVTG